MTVTEPLFRAPVITSKEDYVKVAVPVSTTEIPEASAILTDPASGRSFIVSIEVITPDMAKAYLGTSAGNRPIRKMAVRMKYAPDMKLGRWRLNGETVVFDEEGHLVAGHHRMSACVEAGTPFPTFVIRGTDPESVRTTDTGMSKHISDHLARDGYANATLLQALSRVYLTYRKTGKYASGSQSIISTEDTYALLNGPEGAEVIDAARVTSTFAKQLPFSNRGGISGTLWLLFNRIDSEAAEQFFHKLKTGAALMPGDPVLALRNRLIKASVDREYLTDWSIGYVYIHAWNLTRKGKRLSIMKIPAVQGDSWPEIAQ